MSKNATHQHKKGKRRKHKVGDPILYVCESNEWERKPNWGSYRTGRGALIFRAKAVFANTGGLTRWARDKARESPWEKFPYPPLRTFFPIPFFYQTCGSTANGTP